MSNHILIVDDDARLCKMARINLSERGYSVDAVTSGIQAMDVFEQNMPDLILLDLTMPGMSGIDVCMWMRARSNVPIVILSARHEEHLKVRALDAGADDYVTKPFSYEELLARVRANLRRARRSDLEDAQPAITIGDLTIDLAAQRVTVNGQDIDLTYTEFKLLEVLAQNLDRVVPHAQLLRHVWGPQFGDENHYLYVYLGRIRKKLGHKYAQLLETVARVGYMLRSG